jgi:hypothetical protein
MSKITIATGNTCYGRLARAADGLVPFAEANTDVITLQELRDPEADTFTTQLDRFNYTLVHAAGTAGLAMAVRSDSELRLESASLRHEAFRQMRPWERRLYENGSRLVGQFPERGMIAACFLIDQIAVDIATAHPDPPTRTRSRNRQVRQICQQITG